MVKFTATMHRFEQQGEKTGWTYIEIPGDIVEKIKPGRRREFKVKGKLDAFAIKRVSLMPLGGGRFIMPVNAVMRKGIGKRHGATVRVQIEADDSPFIFNKDFMECLDDEPKAKEFFETLTPSHQRYFSKWISDAKTEQTKVKRITMSVNALSKKWDYGQMLRNQKTSTG